MEPKHSKEIVGEGETSVADSQSADQPGGVAFSTPAEHTNFGIVLDPSQLRDLHQTLILRDPTQTGGGAANGAPPPHQTGHQNQQPTYIQETSNQRGQRRPMMPKVPIYIREYNSKDYDPLVASFGPYFLAFHWSTDKRLALVHEFKAKALEWFVTGTGRDANFWLDKVWHMVPELQCCYTQESTAVYSRDQFN